MTWSAFTCDAIPSSPHLTSELAFHFWDRRRAAFFPECWLVSSTELARRTAQQRDRSYLTVDVRLEASVDRWADCRYPIHDQAEVLRGVLHRLRTAA